MQPLVSPVDHESRNNSYRAGDDEEQGPSESTPLIHRFPAATIPGHRGPITAAVVSLLLLILLPGVIISIYLLILQDSAENILPPVGTPLMLVSRLQWDNATTPLLGASQYKAKNLVAVQTDTKGCADIESCVPLLRQMKESTGDLPYNFLVSSNGLTYEAVGFRALPFYHDDLVLAFIGNFTNTPPTHAQIAAFEYFSAFAESQQRLEPEFEIICKNTKYAPKYLYQSLKRCKHTAEQHVVR